MTDAEEEMRLMIEAIDVSETDESNVQLLSGPDLVGRFNSVTQELLELGQAVHPQTQEGRDLHSQRSAYLIELQRRGLR